MIWKIICKSGTTPLYNEQNRYTVYNKVSGDNLEHYEVPSPGLLHTLGEGLASIVVSAIALGLLLLIS